MKEIPIVTNLITPTTFLLWMGVGVVGASKASKIIEGKNHLITKKVDSQFSSKLVISICSFTKAVRNSGIAKPYFAPYVSSTQKAFTCSKLTTETLEQGVECVPS